MRWQLQHRGQRQYRHGRRLHEGRPCHQDRRDADFSTDNPAFPPWYGGGQKNKPWKLNDPSTGLGYESAVAAAVAAKLGFAPTEVKWIVTPFDKSFAPGPKDFDVFINQVSINPERAQNVDFSSGYYNVNQAVVGLAKKPIATATSVADLKGYKLGAAVGTTSLKAIQEILNKKGARLVADGVYGRGTIAAVVDFQRRNGLLADGEVGRATRKALAG